MRRRGQTLAGALAIGLALTACQSGDTNQIGEPPAIGGDDIDATPTATEPATTGTEATLQDWTPPDPITEEYLLQVMTSLEADRAEFTRWLIDSDANEEPTAEARAALERYFVGGLVENSIQAKINSHAEDPDAPGSLRPYGQYIPLRIEIYRGDAACPLFAVRQWDDSTVRSPQGRDRGGEIIGLLPATPGHNESGWLVRTIQKFDEVPEEDVDQEVQERTLCG